MQVDPKGFSRGSHTLPDQTTNWHSVEEVNAFLTSNGYTQASGNGSDIFNNDRGLGLDYQIEKRYDTNPRRLAYVRLVGNKQRHKTATIPATVRAHHSTKSCVHCGTGSNIQIDHKDGRKVHGATQNTNDFQPLCQHCNLVKRQACAECKQSNRRFDAKSLGYSKSWLSGTRSYGTAGCIGCYWHDPLEFKQSL